MLLENYQIVPSRKYLPGRFAATGSVLAHCIAFVLVSLLMHIKGPLVVVQQTRAVPVVSRGSHVAFNSEKAQPTPQRNTHSLLHASKRRAVTTVAQTAGEKGATEIVREHAKRETAGLMLSIRQRLTYGIPLTDYQLAVQTAGVVPIIPASDIPPRYEQYLVVEITVDIDGTVADARIITGEVEQKVQQKLLSAIREFKYIPAKHNGAPIPSQLDLVVHVPS